MSNILQSVERQNVYQTALKQLKADKAAERASEVALADLIKQPLEPATKYHAA